MALVGNVKNLWSKLCGQSLFNVLLNRHAQTP